MSLLLYIQNMAIGKSKNETIFVIGIVKTYILCLSVSSVEADTSDSAIVL